MFSMAALYGKIEKFPARMIYFFGKKLFRIYSIDGVTDRVSAAYERLMFIQR